VIGVYVKTAAVAALVALAGCGVPVPENLPSGASENFDAAVASVGCELRNERDYLPVELQTGMTREQSLAMAQHKMSTGDAVSLEGGAVRLVTGSCAPSTAG
jgi:predicted small lipoprotein YifL